MMTIQENTSRANPWLVLAVMCLGLFMTLLDTTIVNIAIPRIIGGPDASLDEILWVINAYVLVFAVLLITAGRLGDIFGPKRLFLVGMALFTLAPAGLVLMLIFLLTQYLWQEKEPLVPFSIFRNRNYSLMTLVVAATNFAILGLFLPLTIYLQSELGLSALEAGLTLLPQALISMLIVGPAGELTDRFGGKYILVGGLTLFALGMGYIDWVAEADSGRWSFLPGLIVAGVGLGFTWAPLYNVAMRDIEPQVAGVAAGVFNTIQEMGGVIAGATVGPSCRIVWPLPSRMRRPGAPASFHPSFAAGSWTASGRRPRTASKLGRVSPEMACRLGRMCPRRWRSSSSNSPKRSLRMPSWARCARL